MSCESCVLILKQVELRKYKYNDIVITVHGYTDYKKLRIY